MTGNRKNRSRSNRQASEKQPDRTTSVITALIGALAVIVGAYFAYRGNVDSATIPIEATQTAAARLLQTAEAEKSAPPIVEFSPTATQTVAPSTLTVSPTVVTMISTLPVVTLSASGSFGPGTYLVGTQIEPGIYRGEAGYDALHTCYWERLRDLSGGLSSIIANANNVGQFYVEVQEGDFALETRCELVPLDSLPTPTGAFPQVIEPGTYILGRDIQPGTYQGEGGTDVGTACHWARLHDVSGEVGSSAARESGYGQFFVQTKAGDFALMTTCQLTRVGD